MKRGTTPTLQIQHGLELDTVEKVEFLFKQEKDESAPALLIKTFTQGTVNTEVTEGDGVFFLSFTEEETRLFAARQPFYCDPRITLVTGDIPATDILTLWSSPTLWGENDG